MTGSDRLLYEDDVVSAVSTYLEAHGWIIVSRALAVERGDDIVARKGRLTLRVEAKGEGSSKAGSARYGRVFNSGQVQDHVAKAVSRALGWWSRDAADELSAVAFPDNVDHRRWAGSVADALQELGVGVLWVHSSGSVTIDAPWSP